MNFGSALEALKAGMKVSRSGWNGKGLWLTRQLPGVNSKVDLPYIYMRYPSDDQNTPDRLVSWFPRDSDLFSEDWEIA